MRIQYFRKLAAIGLTLAIAPLARVEAAPFAGKMRDAVAPVRIIGSDGRTYLLATELHARESVDGSVAFAATVRVSQCYDGECSATSKDYAIKIKKANIEADLSVATFSGTFAGLGIEAEWKSGGGGPTPGFGGDIIVGTEGVQLSEAGSGGAAYRVSIGGLKCRGGDGELVGYHTLATDVAAFQQGESSASPPRFLLRSGSRLPRCAKRDN